MRCSTAGILAGAAFAAAWGIWAFRGEVTLYEVTEAARIEVSSAAYPVESPASGRVVSTTLAIGREVREGEILVEVDSSAQRLQVAEEQARLAAFDRDLDAAREQIAAEERTRREERLAALAAADEARASTREAEAPARLADMELERLSQLRAEGLISGGDFERGKAGAIEKRAAVDRRRIGVGRLEQEQRTHDSEREARIQQLQADITRVEGQAGTARAALERLRYEIERRRIRAAANGRLGEVAALLQGSVIREGDKLGSIIPSSELRFIAQFPPSAAIGRIRPGQPARARMKGFQWTQYGTVLATVTRVASEARDGAIRIELALDARQPTAVPLQHGLPAVIEIEVERISPAALLLRNAGRLVAAPRSAFAASRPAGGL